jgi:gamma-glutamyl-gamma-aminobutyrate hydrolase PuuD
MKYFMPRGEWPLRTQPYQDLMKRAGFTEGDENSEILLLPGGADLGMRPGRDHEEFAWFAKWTRDDKPVIGICRGMQLMLHLTGNDNLVEHLPDYSDLIQHTTINGLWTGQSAFHNTELGLLVNSRHHQGFLNVDNWSILDRTADGTIEAVINNKQFGVQWHPEHEEMIGTPAQDWWIETVKSIL